MKMNKKYSEIIEKRAKRLLNFTEKMPLTQTEKLTGILTDTEHTLKTVTREKLLIEAGLITLCDDLDYLVTKLSYRSYQMLKMAKLSKIILKHAKKIGRLIPNKNKFKKRAFLKYIDRLNIVYKQLIATSSKLEKEIKGE